MKNLVLIAFAIGISQLSFAKALDTPDQARAVKNSIQEPLFEIKGVNGIGIGGCNPETGEESLEGDFVYCVTIRTETKAVESKLLKMYPQGTQVRGVYISVKYIGKIVPQPRMSAGG